jgi:hypothetical protein
MGLGEGVTGVSKGVGRVPCGIVLELDRLLLFEAFEVSPPQWGEELSARRSSRKY